MVHIHTRVLEGYLAPTPQFLLLLVASFFFELLNRIYLETSGVFR